MILQHIPHLETRTMLLPGYAASSSPSRSRTPDSPRGNRPEIDNSVDNDCVPLDLSVNSGRLSPGLRDSGTESDDSGGRLSPEGGDCKAYKKSLMKRYCKCLACFICEFNSSPLRGRPFRKNKTIGSLDVVRSKIERCEASDRETFWLRLRRVGHGVSNFRGAAASEARVRDLFRVADDRPSRDAPDSHPFE